MAIAADRLFATAGSRRASSTAVVALLVGVVVLRLPYLGHPLMTQDEAIIPVYAEQILDGRLPHRDFYTAYGPATFGLTALAFTVIGPSLVAERLVGLAYQLLIVGGVYALCAHRGRRAAALAGAVSLVCLTPTGLIAYAWLGGLACIVWGLALIARRNSVVAGMAILSLCALFRPEMLVPAFGAAVFLLRRDRVGPAFAGTLLGLAPAVAYYATWGARALDNIVLERLVADAGLVLGSAAVSVLTLAVAVTGILALQAWRARSREQWAFAALSLFMVPQVFQRPDVDHLMFFLAVSGPLAVVGFTGLLRTPRRPSALARLGQAGVALALAASVAVPLAHVVRSPSTSYEVGGRVLQVTQADARALDHVRALVSTNATPGSRLFVGAMDMSRATISRVQLYFVLPELTVDSYYLELPVGMSESAGAVLAEDVRRADVLLLSDFSPSLLEELNPHIGDGPTRADAIVAREFCRRAGTEFAAVFVRCNQT